MQVPGATRYRGAGAHIRPTDDCVVVASPGCECRIDSIGPQAGCKQPRLGGAGVTAPGVSRLYDSTP